MRFSFVSGFPFSSRFLSKFINSFAAIFCKGLPNIQVIIVYLTKNLGSCHRSENILVYILAAIRIQETVAVAISFQIEL